MNIFITVKPKSREEKVIQIDDSHYVIHIKELPEKGKANAAVIKSLSKHFHITKACVSIISGFTSRQKVVRVIRS